jgi:ubiquinone/menaquinone biosynthesis C-methylase UbiE
MQPEKKDAAYMKQFKCPNGPQGRAVAALMNLKHCALSSWGLKKVKIKPNFFILDMGCGGGKTLSRLAQQAFKGKVFGIDHSPDMVEYSREMNRELIGQNRVSVFGGSVERTGFPDGFFDLVTAIETYYFWFSLPDAFREIKRVLKPKGKLILINEMIKNGVYELENAEIITKTHVHLVALEEIQKILQFVGFMNVEVFTKKESTWNAVVAQKP